MSGQQRGREMARSRAQGRQARPEMDSFGAWISFVVVFASVLASVLVWHNLNDHAYMMASNTAAIGAPVETVGAPPAQ